MTHNTQNSRGKAFGIVNDSLDGVHGEGASVEREKMVFSENSADAARAMHVPVVEKIEGGFKVKVGSVAHPMEKKHYIEWIQVIVEDGRIYRKFLSPGMAPEAVFQVDAETVKAWDYCSVHGPWNG